MPLIFDQSSHTYSLDGRELVSTTRVLREMGLVDPFWFTDEARDRGTRVHQACDRLDEGLTVEDPIALPYMAAYGAFRAELTPAWTHRECPVFNEPMGYAGTLDRAGRIGAFQYVLDIKTGEIPPTVGLQTAAYRLCLLNPSQYARAALQLRDDGTYRLVQLRERSDEAVFLAALTVWHWRRRHLPAARAA